METQELSNIPGNGPSPLVLVPSSFIRQGDHPELPAPLPGILEGYLTILAGAGGVGKTFLAEQIARHIASGVRLGRFDLPDDGPGVVWALFLEDVAALTQQRSLDVAELGSLLEDHQPPDSGADTLWYCDDSLRGIASLRARLQEAKEAGNVQGGPRLPDLIIIDYLHLFIGSQPAGASPVEWERQKLTALREVGIEYGCHVLVLTHMNKEGKVNGTSALLNACDSLFVVEAKDDRNYASLSCRKMRVSPMTDYALSRRQNGTWGFDDEVYVSEALADGIMRDVLAVLRVEGPKTLSQLVMHQAVPGTRNAIRQALTRGRRRKWVTTSHGHWRIVPGDGDTALRPPDVPAAPPADNDRGPDGVYVTGDPEPCHRCGAPTPFRRGGHPYHLGEFCGPGGAPATSPAAAVPAPRAPEAPAAAAADPDLPWFEDGGAREKSKFNGLAFMKKTFEVSRYHPVPVVPKAERDDEPWTLITERMGGEPSEKDWARTDIPMGGQLLLVDRNGSYPSACSSVPLAPNKLLHTGPLDAYDSSKAGIYLVDRPEWNDPTMPHPLGRIASTGEAQVWITTPHLKLLLAQATAGRIAPVVIRDSWTGKANASLFQAFYKAARDARPEYLAQNDPKLGQENPYLLYKQSVSRPLRLLWPKGARSPFYRPDWRVAMVAEASVRHWLKASAAMRQEAGPEGSGAFLISLRNVDEALWWTPTGELPHGYVEGTAFGQVKRKEIDQ